MRGASIKNGLEMLHLQAEKSWEIWTLIWCPVFNNDLIYYGAISTDIGPKANFNFIFISLVLYISE
jgi:hypothetical protein